MKQNLVIALKPVRFDDVTVFTSSMVLSRHSCSALQSTCCAPLLTIKGSVEPCDPAGRVSVGLSLDSGGSISQRSMHGRLGERGVG
jgi:hypothetical protein